MTDKLTGHWKLHKSENVDQFLNAQDYNIVYKQLNKRVPFRLHITRDEDEWSVYMTSAVRNFLQKFKLNHTNKEVGLDGREMKITPCQEGDMLVLNLEPVKKGHNRVKVTFEVSNEDELIQTFTLVDLEISSTRYLQRCLPEQKQKSEQQKEHHLTKTSPT